MVCKCFALPSPGFATWPPRITGVAHHLPLRRLIVPAVFALLLLIMVLSSSPTAAEQLSEADIKLKISYFTRLIQIDRNNAEARFRRSQYYRLLHDYQLQLADLKVAIPKFKAMLDDPTLSDRREMWMRYLQFCYQDQAVAYQALRMYKEAWQSFSNAIIENPKDPNLYKLRAELLLLTGDKVSAQRDMETAKALPDFSQNDEAFFVLLNQALARYREESGFDEAIGFCNQSLKIRPNSVLARAFREKFYVRAGKYRLAIADLKELSHLQPRNERWPEEEARVKSLLKKIPAGNVAAVNTRVGAAEESNSSLQEADAKKLTGSTGEAAPFLKDIDNYIRKYPRDIRGYSARVDYYLEHKKNDAAAADLSTILVIDPTDFRAHKLRAQCYVVLRQKDRALSDYDAALAAIESVAIGTLMVQEGAESIIFSRASALQGFGEYKAAIKDYDTIQAFDPNSEEAYRYRGDCYKKLGNFQRALDDYTNSIKLDKDSAGSSYRARAQIYEQMGKPDLARQDRDRAKALGY